MLLTDKKHDKHSLTNWIDYNKYTQRSQTWGHIRSFFLTRGPQGYKLGQFNETSW